MPWITRALLCLSVTLSLVSATAIPPTTSALSTTSTSLSNSERKRDDDSHIVGATPMQRTVLSSTVVVCVFLLGLALGSRVKQIDLERFRLMHYLVILQTWLSICFTLSVGVLGPGLGLRNANQCRSSIVICIVFYLVGKLLIYQLLIERAHVIRSAFLTRFRDRIWIAFTALNIIGQGALVILAAILHSFKFNTKTGTCNAGLNQYVAPVVFTVHIFINAALTIVFVWLLWPVIRVRIIHSNFGSSKSTSKTTAPFKDNPSLRGSSSMDYFPKPVEQDRHESIAATLNRLGARTSTFTKRHKTRNQKSFFTSVRTMLWRNIVGSTVILAPTLANGILFYVWHARSSAWLCLSLCVIDMSFGTLAIHWLTFGGSTIESYTHRSQSTSTMLPQNGHVTDRSQPPYSDSSVDAPLPELKTYEEVITNGPESPARPEQSHVSGNPAL